jgi:hypothetical protein
MPRDLKREVFELDEDGNVIVPAEPSEPTIVAAAGFRYEAPHDEDRCPRCRRPDSIIFFSQEIRGASTSLQMIGRCERCGFTVPGPTPPSHLRELPEVRPVNDFGRRRRSW